VTVPGKPSRDKGSRREREAAKLLGAIKVSSMYRPGPDLDWNGRDVEVKAQANGWIKLHKWLSGAQILMLKADRKEWLVVMEIGTFQDLIEEAQE